MRPEVAKWFVNAFSWSSYWTNRNINLHATGRNGLILPDEFGNDVNILPAYLYRPAGTEYYYLADNGALDIGATDFTFGGWVKGVDKVASSYLFGKNVNGSKNGRYGFYYAITTGNIGVQIQSSGGAVSIDSTVDVTSGWHLLIADVNQATGKLRLFIDNVQIGADTTFTGTFAALDNAFEFYVGAGNNATGTLVQLISKASHADTFILNRLLTPTERANAQLGIYPTNCKAHWTFCGGGAAISTDISGNGYHLTGLNLTNITNTRFGANGSSYALNNGFSLYTSGQDDIYVPFNVSGAEIIPVNLPAGYKKTVEGNHAGSLIKHNLANSVLSFTGANWDRSSVTIFSDLARNTGSFYDATSAATKKYWHVSELNNLKFQSWANVGYKGLSIVKVSDHSYKDRKTLDEVLSFDSELTGTYYTKAIVQYCKDYVYTDTYEDDFIYWKYTDNSLIATNGLKVLKWENAATDKFHLSLDEGVTYPYSINSPVNGETPKFAYIFNNGNILIGMNKKIYLSINNLTSLSEITIAGFTATDDSFFQATRDVRVVVGGVETLVWGTYSVDADTAYINIVVFYTIDSGVTIKTCYLADTTNPPDLRACHIHGITYRPSTGTWWMFTGDGTGADSSCNIIECTYNWGLDTWSFAKLFGDTGTTWKIASIAFYNSDLNVLIGEDDTSGTYTYGLYTCPIADLGTRALWTNIYKAQAASTVAHMNGNDIIASVVGAANSNTFLSSKTGLTALMPSKLYGLPNNFIISQLLSQKNPNDWYLCSVLISGQANVNTLGNGVLWIKVK